METIQDATVNLVPYLQQGDYVASSFFISALTLAIVALYLFIQLNQVPISWRNPVLIGALIVLVSAVNSFYRRDFYVATSTDPTEFRFFDWFLTVPLMAIEFYLILKPLGARLGTFLRLLIASFWMLIWGYIGEAVFPENGILLGSIASLGLLGIIAVIFIEGYPKIFNHTGDKAIQRGYVFLSIFLPLGWMVYPICFMTTPGNILEGAMSSETVAILYNISGILNKAGLSLGIYLIAIYSQEGKAFFRNQTLIEQTFIPIETSSTSLGNRVDQQVLKPSVAKASSFTASP